MSPIGYVSACQANDAGVCTIIIMAFPTAAARFSLQNPALILPQHLRDLKVTYYHEDVSQAFFPFTTQ